MHLLLWTFRLDYAKTTKKLEISGIRIINIYLHNYFHLEAV